MPNPVQFFQTIIQNTQDAIATAWEVLQDNPQNFNKQTFDNNSIQSSNNATPSGKLNNFSHAAAISAKRFLSARAYNPSPKPKINRAPTDEPSDSLLTNFITSYVDLVHCSAARVIKGELFANIYSPIGIIEGAYVCFVAPEKQEISYDDIQYGGPTLVQRSNPDAHLMTRLDLTLTQQLTHETWDFAKNWVLPDPEADFEAFGNFWDDPNAITASFAVLGAIDLLCLGPLAKNGGKALKKGLKYFNGSDILSGFSLQTKAGKIKAKTVIHKRASQEEGLKASERKGETKKRGSKSSKPSEHQSLQMIKPYAELPTPEIAKKTGLKVAWINEIRLKYPLVYNWNKYWHPEVSNTVMKHAAANGLNADQIFAYVQQHQKQLSIPNFALHKVRSTAGTELARWISWRLSKAKLEKGKVNGLFKKHKQNGSVNFTNLRRDVLMRYGVDLDESIWIEIHRASKEKRNIFSLNFQPPLKKIWEIS